MKGIGTALPMKRHKEKAKRVSEKMEHLLYVFSEMHRPQNFFHLGAAPQLPLCIALLSKTLSFILQICLDSSVWCEIGTRFSVRDTLSCTVWHQTKEKFIRIHCLGNMYIHNKSHGSLASYRDDLILSESFRKTLHHFAALHYTAKCS